jgi:hypothetical protein
MDVSRFVPGEHRMRSVSESEGYRQEGRNEPGENV